MIRFTFLIAVLLTAMTLTAQNQEEAFKPSGKPVVKVFANWHNGFDSSDNQDAGFADESGFEITRAVIGYEYQFSPKISTKVIVDMDDPGDDFKLTEVAYLRNAYVAYKGDKLQAYFGILGMKQFKTQENNWGYRYIYKSAMDHYKFNNSVDAGVYAKYKLTDWVSADLTISNGEGAKSQQDTEGKYRMGYGVEFNPIKPLTIRVYYDYFYSPESTTLLAREDQSSIALFLGYEAEKLRIGAEYNKLQNYKFDGDDDRDIYSIYSSYKFKKDFQAFVRYDVFNADYSDDSETVFMAGLEYKLVKGVKVAPNYRYGDYAFKSSIPGGKGSFFYLNFEYKF